MRDVHEFSCLKLATSQSFQHYGSKCQTMGTLKVVRHFYNEDCEITIFCNILACYQESIEVIVSVQYEIHLDHLCSISFRVYFYSIGRYILNASVLVIIVSRLLEVFK